MIFTGIVFIALYFFNSCQSVKYDFFTKRHDFPKIDDPSEPTTRAAEVLDSLPMRIDHFTWWDRRTFDMRYAYRDTYFNTTGPIFLYIGGEASIEDQLGALYGGLFHDMAKEKGAYMFVTEHRYYGDSVPNLNLETYNMCELTFAQALADIAAFIKHVKRNIDGLQNSKVVVVGGSYPGSLAAWMRLKYPDLIDAAHSSSGVFRMVVDNYEFNEVVQRDISNNTQCLNTIKNGIIALQNLTKTAEGAKKIRKDFGLCEPFQYTHEKEVQNLFNTIGVSLDSIAQYNDQNVYINIDTMCEYLLYNSTMLDDYTRLAQFMVYWRYTYDESQCISSYQSTIGYYRNTGLNSNRPWLYQLCTELGNLVTTDSKNQPYSNTVPISYWYNVCQDTFGILFSPFRVNVGVTGTNLIYGGTHPNVTKVVFTVGTVDPWSSSGLTKDLNPQAPVIRIHGGSHCADLQRDQKGDSEELLNARKKVKEYIYSWIE